MTVPRLLVGLLLWAAMIRPVAAGTRAPDLIPLAPDFREYEWLQAYHVAVKDALLGDLHATRCPVLVLPSFEREWATYVRTVEGRTEVVYVVMQKQLWYEMQRAAEATGLPITPESEQRELARLPRDVHRFSAPLSSSAADVLDLVWKTMLARARAPERLGAGLDGTSYQFFRCPPGAECMAGTAWTPEPNTPAGQLAALAEAMHEHAGAFGDWLKRSELSLVQRANRLLKQIERTDSTPGR